MNEKYLELQWPSRRIPPGGVLHNRKSSYSPEVQNIMKVLMEESKLTLSQRKQVDWCLRTGSCLSSMKNEEVKHKRGMSAPNLSTNQRRLSRKRTLAEIIGSGVFERDKYRSNYRNQDREKIKQQLQDIMEFGKSEWKPRQTKVKTIKKSLPETDDLIYDLIIQIKDRSEWLEEMEALGEGVKHREIINHQIAERIEKIDKLRKQNGCTIFQENDMESLTSEKCNDTLPKQKYNKNVQTSDKKEMDELSLSLSNCSFNGRKKPVGTRKDNPTKPKRVVSSQKLPSEENISDIISLCSRSASANHNSRKKSRTNPLES